MSGIRQELETLYERYNRRSCVHPDPLEFLYRYEDVRDRAVAGLVASGLAYGRVMQILRSVESALDRLGPSPARYAAEVSARDAARAFAGFRHRFTTGAELAALVAGAGEVLRRHGSLERCFATHSDGGATVLPALSGFVAELTSAAGRPLKHLLPDPRRGSACKRLNLFLRWMVRRDAVDPGGWDAVSPATLLVPLDTHMFRVGRALGLTGRRQRDLRAVTQVTAGFRAIAPGDPVRYDFALTRLGLRSDADLDGFLEGVGAVESVR
jgi:uncharacterized protein (TIGR02757 family)